MIKVVLQVDPHNCDSAPESYQVLLNEFKDVFECIGRLEEEHHIVLDENVQPVVNPARRIPFSLHAVVKAELDSMKDKGIIEKTDNHTDWINAIAIAHNKNGKVRVCLDPRLLNKAIKWQPYQLPTFEHIAANITGAKYFTTLDARSGYWQIPLDAAQS